MFPDVLHWLEKRAQSVRPEVRSKMSFWKGAGQLGAMPTLEVISGSFRREGKVSTTMISYVDDVQVAHDEGGLFGKRVGPKTVDQAAGSDGRVGRDCEAN